MENQHQDLTDLVVSLPVPGNQQPVVFSKASLKQTLIARGLYTAYAIYAEYEKDYKGFTAAWASELVSAQNQALHAMEPKYQDIVNTMLRDESTRVARPGDIKELFQKNLLKKDDKTYMRNVGIARMQWFEVFAEKIIEMVSKRANVSFGSVQENQAAHAQQAVQAVLDHHKHVAVASLVLGELGDMDPVIADASCENRPPFVLDMHDIVQDYLKSKGLNAAPAREFQALHKGADYEGNLDLAIKPCPPAFLNLFTELGKAMTAKFPDAVEYLGLCVTLSKSCVWGFDEFGTPYDFQDKTNYYVYKTFPKGDVIDLKPDLKIRMGMLSCAYMKQMANDLAANAPHEVGVQSAEDMLSKVFNSCGAYRHLKGATMNKVGTDIEGRLPLLPIYDCFRVIMMHEIAKKRPINLIVRRIHKNGNAYTLADARVLQYRLPGPGDHPTQNLLIADPNPHDSISPCFTIDAFSVCTDGNLPAYVQAGDNCGNLFSLNSDAYFQTLATSDLFTLVQIYASAHPPFQGDAIVPSLNQDQRAYQQDLHVKAIQKAGWENDAFVQTWLADATRTDTGGLLQPELMDSTQTNLFVEYRTFNAFAQRYLLETAQQIRTQGETVQNASGHYVPKNFAIRIDRPVCFQIEHVKIQSFGEAQAACKSLKDKTANKTFPGKFEIRLKA